MKYYKFNYKSPTGIQVITVPTDSDIGLGIQRHDDIASYKVLDGNTELSVYQTFSNYNIYKVATSQEPSRKAYKVILSGDNSRSYEIEVNSVNSSQSFIEA